MNTPKVLAVTAGAFGAYSVAKSAWYLNTGKACRKCDTTQAVLGLALVAFAGWALISR